MADLDLDAIRARAAANCDICGGRCTDHAFVIHNDVPKLIAALARVGDLHCEWRIFDECGHRHTLAEVDAEESGVISIGLQDIQDVGLVCEDGYTYSICRGCCTDGDGHQTLGCVEDHDNGSCWPCKTRSALDGGETGA